MKLSVAIMAHPKRAHLVGDLEKKLDGAPIVWDERNDRWDTGRRAVLARDGAADYHLVVQDDAILCRKFLEGAAAALEAVPGNPVSFYTGKAQPHATEIRQAVGRARQFNRSWFSWRGPIWGVAVAVPVELIGPMVEAADSSPTPNYDMRMAEYFIAHNIRCWYSIPSLVNHRIGPDNPSLVPGRSSADGRVAYEWIGHDDPTKVDWHSGCIPWMDLSDRKWARINSGYRCGTCGEVFERLAEVITHNFEWHNLGRVDFIATTPESKEIMRGVWAKLPEEARGKIWLVGFGGVPRRKIKRLLSREHRSFTIVDSWQAMRFVTNRAAWSMDNKSEVKGVAV